MGKGSRRRKSFISDEQYRKNWLRIFGKKCPRCDGTGLAHSIHPTGKCDNCDGLGYIEKGKR